MDKSFPLMTAHFNVHEAIVCSEDRRTGRERASALVPYAVREQPAEDVAVKVLFLVHVGDVRLDHGLGEAAH